MKHGCLFAVLLIASHALAWAAVVEVEGKVTAVDPETRIISLERKTPKGLKILELEVAKAAGGLSDLKVGHSISLRYDPDLELVVGLGSGGSSTETSGKPQICRFRIAIGNTGQTTVQVLPVPSGAKATESQRKSLGEGEWQMTNVFTKATDLSPFQGALGKPINVTVDEGSKCMVLRPRKLPGLERPAAHIVYPYRLRVPFVLEIDADTTEREGWAFLQVHAMPRADDMERPVFTFRTQSQLREDGTCDVWSSKMGVKQGTYILEKSPFTTGESWKQVFRLPIPNIKTRDWYTVTIGSLGGPGVKTSIHRVSVEGFPVPVLGLGFGTQGDVVFVAKVIPNTVAADADIQVGDVVMAIDEQKPSSLSDAVELCSDTGFGEDCVFKLKRGEDNVTATLRPRWGN